MQITKITTTNVKHKINEEDEEKKIKKTKWRNFFSWVFEGNYYKLTHSVVEQILKRILGVGTSFTFEIFESQRKEFKII